MIYCINPDCKDRQNLDELEYCQSCGTPLLINGRYRLLKPLLPLNPRNYTDIFEVDDGGTRKVMKVLKDKTSQLIKMFEREAYTLQILNHPGIPQVDIDGYFPFTPKESSEELHCLVMEKIEGQNLEDWLAKNKPISQRQAMNWLRQLIEILDILHQNGFFHRDIKPSNIMLKPDGKLALIDFGTVRDISPTYLAKLRGNINITITISGGYTPQEQLDGEATPQSDFFALGRTFVHLMTGKSPLDLEKNPQTGKLIWRDKARQISKPLADFIDEMMAFEPGNRPQDTGFMLRTLTGKRLLLRSIQLLLNSPRFKLSMTGLIVLLATTGSLMYWLGFPRISQYYYDLGLKEQQTGQSGQYDRAWDYYHQALWFNPKDSRIYNNMGLICKKKGDFKCATINYEKAIEFDPYNPVTSYNLGVLYDDSGDFDRAQNQYQRTTESDRSVAAYAFSAWGRLKILQGYIPTAIALSKQGLKKADNDGVKSALHKNLGWANFIQTNYQEAEINLQQSIKLDPERADAYCLLAQVLEARGNKTSALDNWQKCWDKDAKKMVEVLTWQTTARQRLNEVGKK